MTPPRVLIIDDHRDSAEMLAALLRLRKPGLAVEVAYDGESALTAALSSRHDVAIIDLNLPGIDGGEVAAKIRTHWGSGSPVLVALSGSVAQISHHQNSGVFDHALTKPVNVERLLSIVQQ